MLGYKVSYIVDRIDKNNQHFYSINGIATLFPGSTTILSVIAKLYLVPWSSKMTATYTTKILKRLIQINDQKPIGEILTPRFLEMLFKRSKKQHKLIKEKAGNIGTRAHAAIDQLIRGEVPVMEEDIRQCVTSFVDWDTIKKLRIIGGDTKVLNIVDGYGGTVDAFAEDEHGKLVVMDFKTSNQISDEYAYQIASYCVAVKHTYGLSYIPEGICIRFDKVKPEIEFRKVRDVKASFEGFMAAHKLYHNKQLIHFINRKVFKAEKGDNNVKTRKNRIRTSTDGKVGESANR